MQLQGPERPIHFARERLHGRRRQFFSRCVSCAISPCELTQIPPPFHDHQGMGNFDYILSSKHTLSGRYFFETGSVSRGTFASNGTRITASNVLPGFPVSEEKHKPSCAAKASTSVLSNNLVNEARVSYQRLIAVANQANSFTNSQVGITDLTPGVDNLSEITLSGLSSFGSNTAFGVNNKSNQFQFADQVSWTHGIHSFRTGAEVERIRNDVSTPGTSFMNITFQSWPDFLLGRPACLAGATGPLAPAGTPAAQVAPNGVLCNGGTTASNIKSVGGTTLANGAFVYPFRVNYIDAFVQDDIKLSPRFTLNAGVRWEWDGFPTVANGVTSNFWPGLAGAAGLPGSGCAVKWSSIWAWSSRNGMQLDGICRAQ